ESVIGGIAGELVLGQRRARQDTAGEPSARLATSGVKSLRAGFVQQLDGDEVALVVGPRVAQLQRKARPVAAGVLGEVHPVLNLRRREGHAGDLFALTGGVVAVPADLRKRDRPPL